MTKIIKTIKEKGIKHVAHWGIVEIKNKVRNRMMINRRVVNPPLPRYLQIETSSKCNFNCIMCNRKEFSPQRLNKDLTLEQLKNIINNAPQVEAIQMFGEGEPFLNPNLGQMLEYCKKKKIAIWTSTNGSIIDKHPEWFKYYDKIAISLDCSNAETYEKIRIGGDFKKTLKNIKLLIEEKEKNKYKTDIFLTSVISHMNFKEIPAFIEIAKSVGIAKVGFTEVENWHTPGEEGYVKELEFISKAREKSKEIESTIKEMKEKHPEMEIIYTSSEKTKKNCGRPFEWVFITVDGFVTPCCRRVNPEVINFGNIFETPLKEIWYSTKAQDFRKSILYDTPNPICDMCPD